MSERLATEDELDSILVDVWSFRKNGDGLMERTGVETLTLRESCRRSGALPLVTVRQSDFLRGNQRTGDEVV
jgi:hypothetical protein